MDGAEKMSKLPHEVHVESASEQRRLPVAMRLRHGLHGDQMLLLVLENQRGHRRRRCEMGQPPDAESFAMNTRRIAVPLYGDSQLGQ